MGYLNNCLALERIWLYGTIEPGDFTKKRVIQRFHMLRNAGDWIIIITGPVTAWIVGFRLRLRLSDLSKDPLCSAFLKAG